MVFLAIFSPDLVGFVQKRHHWWVGRSVAWSVRRWPFWALCVCLCECTCNEPATTTAHNCSTHTRTPAHTRTPNAMVLVAFRRRSVHLLSAPDPDAALPAIHLPPPTTHPTPCHTTYLVIPPTPPPRRYPHSAGENETAKQTRFGINQRWSTIYIVGCLRSGADLCNLK